MGLADCIYFKIFDVLEKYLANCVHLEYNWAFAVKFERDYEVWNTPGSNCFSNESEIINQMVVWKLVQIFEILFVEISKYYFNIMLNSHDV